MRVIDGHCHIRGSKAAASEVLRVSGISGFLNINYACDGTLQTLDSDRAELTDWSGLAPALETGLVLGFPASEYFLWTDAQRTAFLKRLDVGLGDPAVVGIKLWKDLGMLALDDDHKYVLPDDGRLDSVLGMVATHRKIVYVHCADPVDAWRPVEGRPEQVQHYLRQYPAFDMYLKSGAPSHERLVEARERLVGRWSQVGFVVCHLGDFAYGLEETSQFLQRHHNAAVDTAGRLGALQRESSDRAREFFIAHAQQVVFGTDWTPDGSDEQTIARGAARYRKWRAYFEEVLALPIATLRDVYAGTLTRLIRAENGMPGVS